MKNKAVFKWNNGNLALLCSRCRTIIKEGIDFTDRERECCSHGGGCAKYYLPPQYCSKCKIVHKNE
jgi:hypothetical protein